MSKLFEPIQFGPLKLKNRLMMTAMSTGFAGTKGEVTDRLTEFYAARAAGGTAVITVENTYIHPQLPHIDKALGMYADHLIPGYRHLTDRIHEEGGLASVQVGLYFRQQVNGFPRYAPSASAPDCSPACKELTHDEIDYLTGLFVKAAERTRSAGFDAIEIHACHGCLVAEFLSPFWNHRTDKYGGSPEGRFRFSLEILRGIRKQLGPDYPVLFRISGSEFTPEGFTPEDAVAFSIALERDGVTAISISGGLGHVNHVAIPPGDVPRGILLPMGKSVKEAVNVPIIVGNSMTPELAQEAVETDMADMIGLGRPLIADPQWPQKVKEGKLDEIRECIRCNQGCFAGIRDPKRPWISCMYNKVAGREFENPIEDAAVKRRIVVVGGGPTGCEVARVSRLRGHEVILLEKADRLGGQINVAAIPPQKGDFNRMVAFYKGELKRIGVDVRLNTKADSNVLNSIDPDVVVIATGSVSVRPSIPGVEKDHVFMANDILSETAEIKKGPVLVAGGGASGLETADFLSDKGLEVSVVEMLDGTGRDIFQGIGVREGLHDRNRSKDVSIITGHRIMEIFDDTVLISDRPLIGGGEETHIPANAVVLALGMKTADELMEPGPEHEGNTRWYRVGDCVSPGNAFEAIHQAFELALTI
jgi:2,4-dienoyl-CoA reductase-like NADH-dependent reductase (Old Yellow Enzyme family)/thioredoxin reductase